MLEIPNKYKIRIINRYGKEGENWLESIGDIVDKYARQFQLEDIKLVENLTINMVMFAKSHLYGDVVLKIGTPGRVAITEINAMQCYSSKYVPKVINSNIEDRVMLLERILPGYSLEQIKNREERIKIFSDFYNHLLVEADNKKGFLTFEEMLEERIREVYENKQDYSAIIELIDKANEFYHELKGKNLKKFILHDDLRHANILKSKEGWKAIDPHGIIGEKIIETSHLIRAELKVSNLEKKQVEEVVALVAKYTKEDENMIFKSLYIMTIFKIIGYIKLKYEKPIISYHIKICRKILPYIID